MKRSTITRLANAAVVALLPLTVACEEEVVEQVYRLEAVSERDISVSVSAAGAVEPVRTVEVKSKASGEIFQMRVETGDYVQQGNLLVQIDPRVPQATLRQAEADSVLAQAQLENAQSQLRRAEALHQTESITEQEYDDAKLAVASAEASLVRAERSLEDARISAEDTDVRSPITGVVIVKNVEEGTVITSATQGASGGTVLLQMANLDTVQVRTLVDETDIGQIQPNMAATIRVDAYPNRPFRGRVLKIEPQAQVAQNVTMFPVLVRIPNSDGLLRPGMSAEVEISVGNRRGVLAIPNAAMRTERDYASAAGVLGLDLDAVRSQLEQEPFVAGSPPGETESTNSRPTQGTEFASRPAMHPDRPQGGFMGGQGRGPVVNISNDLVGGDFVVFAMRNGNIRAVRIRTGLTDLNYSEVVSGLTASDTVLILQSGSAPAGGGDAVPGGGRGMGGGRPPGR
ncbi:MAG: efflux RND transporter periplasmic adaptor subunit [Gemmatimonadota bacterium]|nr:MAG: efflux RND transporter periplasmic adaptor subunit [Gemmatimonadota bacterium]